MGNGMQGARESGVMLYSGECRQTFRGMLPNILWNVAKHSGECPQIFRGMFETFWGRLLLLLLLLLNLVSVDK